MPANHSDLEKRLWDADDESDGCGDKKAQEKKVDRTDRSKSVRF
jgi:hypothetical protein